MTPQCTRHRRIKTPRDPKYRGVETPRCPKYWGVETPRCPMYRGVAKLDPLKIQNSPKYRGVETPGVLCTGESFFVSLNLQAHAAAFKATVIQKSV